MIDIECAMRLAAVHQRLIQATYREIKKDGHHKSSEASMTVSMHLPNAFEQGEGPLFSVEAYSYLLNPDGRLQTWRGKTMQEAVSKAEDAISDWVMMSEMEEFEDHFRPVDVADEVAIGDEEGIPE